MSASACARGEPRRSVRACTIRQEGMGPTEPFASALGGQRNVKTRPSSGVTSPVRLCAGGWLRDFTSIGRRQRPTEAARCRLSSGKNLSTFTPCASLSKSCIDPLC